MSQKDGKFLVFLSLLIVVILLSTSVSFATGPLYGVTKDTKITHKLWRGLLNIPFSLMEIPLEINKEWQNKDPFTGICVGFGKGAVLTWRRATTGIWEVLTFPIEIPQDFRPLLEPEFPMMDVVE